MPFRWSAATASLLVAALLQVSCTFLVDSKAGQCRDDGDCAKFGDSVCKTDQLICVPAPVHVVMDAGAPMDAAAPADIALPADTITPAGDAPASCQGPGGCFSCAPKSDLDFLNACTDGRCLPFDNRKRLTNLTPEGALRPLP